MLGAGGAGELGIDRLVRPAAERGRLIDTAEKIGEPLPWRVQERGLVDGFGARAHGRRRVGGPQLDRASRRDFRDVAFAAQLREISRFVRVAGLLDQNRAVVVDRPRGQTGGIEEFLPVERGRMRAAEKRD